MLYERIRTTTGRLFSLDKDIGFYVSGGIDSTVLLYTCCLLRQELSGPARFHSFTIPVGQDVSWARSVIHWLEGHFQLDLDHTVVEYDQRLPSHRRVSSTLLSAAQECDFILLGDTTNPRDIRPGPRRVVSTNRRFVQPMIEWTKREVIALAQEIGMPDELMLLTNSCDFDRDCGSCWACTERAWGFEANGIKDPKIVVAEAGIEPATNGL